MRVLADFLCFPDLVIGLPIAKLVIYFICDQDSVLHIFSTHNAILRTKMFFTFSNWGFLDVTAIKSIIFLFMAIFQAFWGKN